jgi:hypothetical protein
VNLLPRWKCHKEVQAAKIVAIWPGRKLGAGPGATLAFEDGSWVSVGEDYMSKHRPAEGGYYVAYEDGYSSFSPAAAFEAGYTMIGPPVPRCAMKKYRPLSSAGTAGSCNELDDQ